MEKHSLFPFCPFKLKSIVFKRIKHVLGFHINKASDTFVKKLDVYVTLCSVRTVQTNKDNPMSSNLLAKEGPS